MLEGYRARVDERTFLNLPGFRNGNAFVYVYVEDTSAREPMVGEYCTDECTTCPTNFEPRMILQVCDGDDVASFGFDVDTPRGRENSLYKLDTMIAALRVFRTGFVAEFAPYDRRERQIEELKDTTRAAHRRPGLRGRGSDGRAPRLQRGGAGSIPAVSITASVVSREARTLRTVEAQVRLLPEALHTPVAQRMSTVLRWRGTLVRLQPGVLRCCGPAQIRLSIPHRQVAGSNPARGFRVPR